jgi:signal recognition particle subunit SRP54
MHRQMSDMMKKMGKGGRGALGALSGLGGGMPPQLPPGAFPGPGGRR